MMGWRPHEVRACAVPEFLAALDGFRTFHGGEKQEPEGMSRARLEELMEQYPDGR